MSISEASSLDMAHLQDANKLERQRVREGALKKQCFISAPEVNIFKIIFSQELKFNLFQPKNIF